MTSELEPSQSIRITAKIDEHGTATLRSITASSTTILDVPDGERLADDLERMLSPTAEDTFRDTYAVLPTSEGVSLKRAGGAFSMPWQWITTNVESLRT